MRQACGLVQVAFTHAAAGPLTGHIVTSKLSQVPVGGGVDGGVMTTIASVGEAPVAVMPGAPSGPVTMFSGLEGGLGTPPLMPTTVTCAEGGRVR